MLSFVTVLPAPVINTAFYFQRMNKIVGSVLGLGRTNIMSGFHVARELHFSAAVNTSVFMKKQKKVDPELAKIRENRKRLVYERNLLNICSRKM